MFQNKNVLVTGGAGMTGHEVVAQLLERGAHVRATVFNNPTLPHRTLKIDHNHLEIFPCDLIDNEQCKNALKDIDIVVNCLALICGAKGQTDTPLSLIRNNLVPYINIIESACIAGVEKFAFISSSTMYPESEFPVTEDEAFLADPAECYFGFGWMKRYCEKLCENFHKNTKTKFALIRTGSIYGPHDIFDIDKSHVIPSLILKAHRKDDPFEVWGDGNQKRDCIHVSQLVDGLLTVLDKHAVVDPINIASGQSYSVNEITSVILNKYGYKPEKRYILSKPTMVLARYINIDKAKKILGWTNKVSLEEGINNTVDWYEQNVV